MEKIIVSQVDQLNFYNEVIHFIKEEIGKKIEEKFEIKIYDAVEIASRSFMHRITFNPEINFLELLLTFTSNYAVNEAVEIIQGYKKVGVMEIFLYQKIEKNFVKIVINPKKYIALKNSKYALT